MYAASKRMSEELVAFAARQCPMTRFVVARFFNVYGPGETNPHLIPDILRTLAAGDRLKLGNLEARRDYVYVTDIVDALVRMTLYAGARSVFNVGTGRGASAHDIVRELENILERPLEVEVDPAKLRPIDRPSLVADTTLARADLRWTARVALHAGLEQMVTTMKIR